MKTGFNFFDNIYVINLKRCKDRKEYIQEHFAKFKIKNYEFFEATDKNDKIVKAYYLNGFVMPSPPCFRCLKDVCNCDNNVLIPQQIGNWASFIRLMSSIAASTHEGLVLICEDDVIFADNSEQILNSTLNEDHLKALDFKRPIILRLEKRDGQSPIDPIPKIIKWKPVMSNACFAINKLYAQSFLSTLKKITMTSDMFIQAVMPLKYEGIQSLCLTPPIATQQTYELSMHSEIHPKGIDEIDKERKKNHIKSVKTKDEYTKLFREWTN